MYSLLGLSEGENPEVIKLQQVFFLAPPANKKNWILTPIIAIELFNLRDD